MHSSSTTQRKNKPKQGSSITRTNVDTKNENGGVLVSLVKGENDIEENPNSNELVLNENAPLVAVAYRRECGTSPFDKQWLNLDCCGIFCALLTYSFHLYACYAVCFILIPPWMFIQVEDLRYITLKGRVNELLFCSISLMACLSHYKAMTIDPEDDTNETIVQLEIPSRKRICRRCNSYKPIR